MRLVAMPLADLRRVDGAAFKRSPARALSGAHAGYLWVMYVCK
jgi:hypothetical protein